MKREDWERVETIFHVALETLDADREGYLTLACGGDAGLRAEVNSLITSFGNDPGFMEQSALELGMLALGDNSGPSLSGQSIGAYLIREKLGGGGMGDVYLAEDTRLKRDVALKFLTTSFLDDKWAKRQLEREAQAVAMLDHQNICHVYGFEEIGEHRFIVMQYLKGDTLSHLIHEKRIEPEQVLPMARQIIDAIAAAHEHGIIHRDIKPGNIMIAVDGQVKVLDFGLAKIVHDKNRPDAQDDNFSQVSRQGLILGTVAYMSPEQLKAEKLDFRSDIFSLGTVLFELATGVHPFERKSDAETISAILSPDPPVELGSAPKMRIPLKRVVKKCLEKEKEQRYQSASELLLDIQSPAEPPSPRWSGLHWRLITTTMLLMLVAAGLFAYFRTERVYSVAVLPFVNETADGSFDYLADGIAESLTGRLAESRGFRVIAYTKLSGYHGDADPTKVGRDVEVDLIVTGKIIRQNDQLTLRTSLIDASDGTAVRAGENPLDASDMPTVEKAIVAKLFSGLEIQKSKPSQNGSRQLTATANGEAFRQYLIGRYYWRKRDKENIQKAISAFQQAIDLDPGYSRAYAGLADSYVLMNLVAYGTIPTKEAMTKARAAAKQALEIEPNNAEAHTSLGVILTKYDWNWAEAERELRRAIEINPEYAAAHYWISDLLAMTGRAAESVNEAEKAKELDPFSTIVDLNLARTYYYGRKYDKTVEILAKQNAIDQNTDKKIKYMVGLSYIQKGMYGHAAKIFEDISVDNKLFGAAALGYTYAKLGRRSDAAKLIAELQQASKGTFVLSHEIAIIYIGLNERDKAFQYLNQSFRERNGALISLKVEPLFDPIRNDERFGQLLRQMALN